MCFARLVAARLSHVNGARVMAQGDYLQLLRLLCRDLSSDKLTCTQRCCLCGCSAAASWGVDTLRKMGE